MMVIRLEDSLKNYKISAEITGVSEDLIYHFYVILQCLSSGENINIDKFEVYCWETAELYTNLYSWYYMPPSVHKILIYGSSIIKSFVLPIGILSEEAQESRNKTLRGIESLTAESLPGLILILTFFKGYYYHRILL